MKKFIPQLLNIMVILLILAGCTNPKPDDQEIQKLKDKITALNEIAAPAPASLDSLYPPKAEFPVYLFEMLKLNTSLTGIGVDLFENDIENMTGNFEKFKAQYAEISKLVPEWEKMFPVNAVDNLGIALETKDQGKIMAAFEEVGKICHDCHASSMAKVQLKYHWKDFGALKAQDPVTGEELPFSQFKHYMSSAFTGIEIDIQQGQKENARKQFRAFNARFQTLIATCDNCHQSPREYYVDENVQSLIDKLGKAINEPDIDSEKVATLMQGIGMESCFQCHLVHVPASTAKYNRDKWEKINNTP